MTHLVVDTPTLQALAQRVDDARCVAADVEGWLRGSGTRTGDFLGPAEPVGVELAALLRVVGDCARGSADDLLRLGDGVQVLAELWAEVERRAETLGDAQ